MPRARHSRTMRARVEPGADGIAMISSSGSASSRIRGSSSSVLPANPHALDPQAPLARVVVEEPDRHEAELAVAHDLAHDHPPALPRPGDQDRALALAAAAERRQRAALVDAARDRARTPTRNTSASSANRMITPFGRTDRDGVPVAGSGGRAAGPRRATTVQQDDHDDRAHHRLVVALPGVAPAALVDPAQDQHGKAPERHPPDRRVAQVRVARRRSAVEAQLEGEVVRERDQRTVDRELRQGMTMQR